VSTVCGTVVINRRPRDRTFDATSRFLCFPKSRVQDPNLVTGERKEKRYFQRRAFPLKSKFLINKELSYLPAGWSPKAKLRSRRTKGEKKRVIHRCGSHLVSSQKVQHDGQGRRQVPTTKRLILSKGSRPLKRALARQARHGRVPPTRIIS
jgi:hypothetical protein